MALIHGVGTVQRGKSGVDPLSGDVSMGSDTVSAAFRSAVEDDDVRAIVFRIDSPGGSYVASDTIWREVSRARAAASRSCLDEQPRGVGRLLRRHAGAT